MDTSKIIMVKRYTDAHFQRSSGDKETGRIHRYNPETRFTLCGLNPTEHISQNRVESATGSELRLYPHCKRCERSYGKAVEKSCKGAEQREASVRSAVKCIGRTHLQELRAQQTSWLRDAFTALAVALHANGFDWSEVRALVNGAEEDAAETDWIKS